ncbi:hypothetical protein BGZ47_006263 [Haplosporangium gracile]|nr:hypothetical protein BGZ47_006263 [Haplosporangium gracile]
MEQLAVVLRHVQTFYNTASVQESISLPLGFCNHDSPIEGLKKYIGSLTNGKSDGDTDKNTGDDGAGKETTTATTAFPRPPTLLLHFDQGFYYAPDYVPAKTAAAQTRELPDLMHLLSTALRMYQMKIRGLEEKVQE